LLRRAEEHYVGLYIDEEHSAIGEQCGLVRMWVVEEIGDEEVLKLCFQACRMIGELLNDVQYLVGLEFHIPNDSRVCPDYYQVLLETDLNPQLVDEWGWNLYSNE
jgi:hypothetical protein